MFLFRQSFVNQFLFLVGFFVMSQNMVNGCEVSESGTVMTGDYQFSGNVCVANILATNALVACDATLPMLVDFTNTNSFVVREKSGDQVTDCLTLAPAGITARKDVLFQNNLIVNGKITQGTSSNLAVSGAKVLSTAITSTAATVLTVNFSQNSGAALVHIVLFGDTGFGDITYESWIFLGTGNSSVKNCSSDVTAGPVPNITTNFDVATGTASFTLATDVGESITSPYIFYEVYGNKISSVA